MMCLVSILHNTRNAHPVREHEIRALIYIYKYRIVIKIVKWLTLIKSYLAVCLKEII